MKMWSCLEMRISVINVNSVYSVEVEIRNY